MLLLCQTLSTPYQIFYFRESQLGGQKKFIMDVNHPHGLSSIKPSSYINPSFYSSTPSTPSTLSTFSTTTTTTTMPSGFLSVGKEDQKKKSSCSSPFRSTLPRVRTPLNTNTNTNTNMDYCFGSGPFESSSLNPTSFQFTEKQWNQLMAQMQQLDRKINVLYQMMCKWEV